MIMDTIDRSYLKEALCCFFFYIDKLIGVIDWPKNPTPEKDAARLDNCIKVFLLISHHIGENEDVITSEDCILRLGHRKDIVRVFKKKLRLAQKSYSDELSSRLGGYESTGMNANNEKDILQTFLELSDENAVVFVKEVLNDSEEDPHFSAVRATSDIFLLTELYHAIGMHPELIDLQSYLASRGFSDSEYEFFDDSRRKESEYYRGHYYSFPTQG